MGTNTALVREGHIVLTLSFEREDGQWVGTCLELGTSTFAKDIEKAQEELHELIFLHLDTLEEEGERGRFFDERGIEIHWESHTADEEISLRLPVGPSKPGLPLRKAPFFQPHIFPVPELEGALAGAHA